MLPRLIVKSNNNNVQGIRTQGNLEEVLDVKNNTHRVDVNNITMR